MDWRKHYRKAVTFSYDDGNEQDISLLEIFRQYGLKATFHVNTGLNRENGTWQYGNLTVHRLNLTDCADMYRGHEIAMHGRMHRNLTQLNQSELEEELKENLTEIIHLFGTRPLGIAYAYGVYNDMVLNTVKKLGLRYGRGVNSTHTFSERQNLLCFQPTCHHDDAQLFHLAEQFLEMKPETPQIFYIWGHSYELEGKHHWDRMRQFCEYISGKDDIFYGTNREVLL